MRLPKFEPPAVPGPFPELSGTISGVLDPEQPSRLLRTPQSILSFASFDPEVALPHGLSRLSNLSLNDEGRCCAKRIVIETIPGRGSFWRWVPTARKRDHVFDEGTFPRLVDVCGKTYLISQDQWDIYKLDPCYDCFVDDFSRRSVITKRDPADYEAFFSSSTKSATEDTPQEPQTSEFSAPDGYDDKMAVDDEDASYIPPSPSKLNSPHRQRSPLFDFTSATSSSFEKPKTKRAANASFQSLRDREDEENEYFKADSHNRNTKSYAPKIKKRARTLSPSSSSRILHNQRMKREKDKQTRWEAKRRRVPQSYFQGNGPQCPDIPEDSEGEDADLDNSHETPDSESGEESEGQRLTRLEESRRKMAELNADRARQRQREQHDRVEEPMRRARTEEPRQSAQVKERGRQEEARRRREETAKQQQQARQRRAALLERAERERMSRHGQWSSGPWSTVRALERYASVSAFFDKAKFSEENLPLTWIDVPWPVLLRPSHITLDGLKDIEAAKENVDQFFLAAKLTIRGQQYKDFVRNCLQRLHSDRWSSRRLEEAIIDAAERKRITDARNHVAGLVGSVYEVAKLEAAST
ncbi:hypothetical protein CPB84DRAFT_1770028 [Gymnopilus junonius]|uniref:Uncharacterized protein n=1 Tax=Gymnopilus junonius TaxID=109634 RepID=A0A9P5TRD6_GYMJU|nr:hypothetical protein CPB84DRAFT_1770028 [Gymnopilus junonius]